jgi:hypothetical protein
MPSCYVLCNEERKEFIAYFPPPYFFMAWSLGTGTTLPFAKYIFKAPELNIQIYPSLIEV